MKSQHRQWSLETFGRADLGDARRTHRAVRLAATAAERPNGRISSVFLSKREQEAAYDFVENEHIPPEAIAEAVSRATARASADCELVFVPVDGTSLKLWDGTGKKDFGRIGSRVNNATGLKVINALALTSAGVPIGLCSQTYWCRPRNPGQRRHHKKRPLSEKETKYGIQTLRNVAAVMAEEAPNTRAWFQLDRGFDAWSLLQELTNSGQLFTVRSSANRRLESSKGQRRLCQTLHKQPVFCTYNCDISERIGRKKKSDRKGRQARLAVRKATVTLELHERKNWHRFSLTLNAVLVREQRTTPKGEKPIEWLLLTNYPIQTKKQIETIVFGYSLRWRIEDFHKAWKSGCCNVEETQLHSTAAVIRWATILAAVATRAERLKHLARTTPDEPATVELSEPEVTALVLLKRKHKSRKETIRDNPSIGEATLWIAELGGFTGKSSGGPPGTITIARGLERLVPAAEMVQLLRKQPR
jgi:hypothetical protein